MTKKKSGQNTGGGGAGTERVRSEPRRRGREVVQEAKGVGTGRERSMPEGGRGVVQGARSSGASIQAGGGRS